MARVLRNGKSLPEHWQPRKPRRRQVRVPPTTAHWRTTLGALPRETLALIVQRLSVADASRLMRTARPLVDAVRPELYSLAAAVDVERTGWPRYLIRAGVLNQTTTFAALLNRMPVSNAPNITIGRLNSLNAKVGKPSHGWKGLEPVDKTKSFLWRGRASTSLVHVVCHLRNREMIELLLAHGEETRAKDAWERTPIHVAAERGNLVALQTLLAHDPIDVNEPVEGGNSWGPLNLLQCATLGKQPEAVQVLLDKGAEPRKCDVYNWNGPLSIATRFGHMELLRRLLGSGGCDQDSIDQALHRACRMSDDNSLAMMKALFDAGARPCEAALVLACGNYIFTTSHTLNFQKVKMVLEYGFDPHATGVPQHCTNYIHPALDYAAKYADIDVLAFLLDSGIFNRDYVRARLSKIYSESRYFRSDDTRIKMLLDAGVTTIEDCVQWANAEK